MAHIKVYQSFVARMQSGERRVDVVEFMKLGEVLGFDSSAAMRNLMDIENDIGK